MVIQLSLRNKNLRKRITFVILCAGEGIRLEEITNIVPKPLIKIKAINNCSILQHTINNLIKLDIEKIAVVKGHLGNKIDEFIASFTKFNNIIIKEKLVIIDSGTRYKLGPLYSFLSIIKNENVFLKENIFVIIPGDTIFEYNLLREISTFLLNNFSLIQKYPYNFYREIKVIDLKKKYEHKKIAVSEIEKIGTESFLRNINQHDLILFPDHDYIRQTIPLFIFSYNFIKEIIEFEKKTSAHTIREILNSMIKDGKKIISVKIDCKFDFYDIDYDKDINLFDISSKENEGQ